MLAQQRYIRDADNARLEPAALDCMDAWAHFVSRAYADLTETQEAWRSACAQSNVLSRDLQPRNVRDDVLGGDGEADRAPKAGEAEGWGG